MKTAVPFKQPAKPASPVASLILFADAYRDPSGGYTVKPRAPRSLVMTQKSGRWIQEIGTIDACRILNVNRATIHTLINKDPDARRLIKWRFTSKGRGKRVFEVGSLLAYVEWTKTLEG